jgi:hypothetical protein
MNSIHRLLEPMLRLLLPPTGRRRLTHQRAASPRPRPPAIVAVSRRCTRLRGEDSRLVRPYVIAQEERDKRRSQRQRRRAVWLALRGVDVGPRLIHGVVVTG